MGQCASTYAPRDHSYSNLNTTQKQMPFKKKYKVGAHIATGTFADVKHCTRKSDRNQFAVKIVQKNKCSSNELALLRDEIDIYSSLNHPHIITLVDIYENNHIVQIVLELCNEQNLRDITRACPHYRLKESDCAHITHIIASTLKYLHSKDIVHRDLKPENVLFTKDNVLKITDFGSAFTTKNRSKYLNRSLVRLPSLRMNTVIGTPNYVAPEILQGFAYSYRVDLWSLGVILFECISGYHPFATQKNMKTIGKLYDAIQTGKYKMGKVWDSIDNSATDLVKNLLYVNPKQRIMIDKLLKHPFLMKYAEMINPFSVNKGKKCENREVIEEARD